MPGFFSVYTFRGTGLAAIPQSVYSDVSESVIPTEAASVCG
jgi:hypothetical protein